MSNKFKQGDRVRCIDSGGTFGELRLGEKYTVRERSARYINGKTCIRLSGVGNRVFFEDRFELVSPSGQIIVKGDIVKLKTGNAKMEVVDTFYSKRLNQNMILAQYFEKCNRLQDSYRPASDFERVKANIWAEYLDKNGYFYPTTAISASISPRNIKDPSRAIIHFEKMITAYEAYREHLRNK